MADRIIARVGDDVVLPFAVSALDVRGRAVQLGPVLDSIVSRHGYPAPVARLMGEALALTVLLGTSLKFDGKFVFQTRSDGPVSLLVVDYRTSGAVRAYARFDKTAVTAAAKLADKSPHALLGRGTLAFTIDQGAQTQRFQGIVELDGASLEAAAQNYFLRSEQIPTTVRLAVAEMWRPSGPGRLERRWRAGGLLTQFLPKAAGRVRAKDLPAGDRTAGAKDLREAAPRIAEDDAWLEAQALAKTAMADELTDPDIGSERLLYRLFHERGVRVFAGKRIRHECSCSKERIVAILRGLPEDDRRQSFASGSAVTTCEFCGTVYTVAPQEV